jgi:hypothetical protein
MPLGPVSIRRNETAITRVTNPRNVPARQSDAWWVGRCLRDNCTCSARANSKQVQLDFATIIVVEL